ncbi:MAG: MmcQ/YjbR family DNA-binding protein [Gammaproteobacteria bacterium]|nr:MmcQ/YjbR family DNA-binding protein [Gammaproteobacteria bacterium]
MDAEAAKTYLLSKPEAIEDYPFGPEVSVFKVRDKMFASLAYSNKQARIILKCDPEQALILRYVFAAVIPGYHMNKQHWNTVILDGSIAADEIQAMIDHSYGLVVKGMEKSVRTSLELQHGSDEIYK